MRSCNELKYGYIFFLARNKILPVLVEDVPLKTVCALPAIPQAMATMSLVPVPQQEPSIDGQFLSSITQC